MKSFSRAAVPCVILLVLMMIPPVLRRDHFPDRFLGNVLQEIRTTPDVLTAIQKFENYAAFYFGTSWNLQNPQVTRPLFDTRFQVAQILQQRGEPEYLAEALRQYQIIDEYMPDYNYGWVQYSIGQILEQRGAYDDAETNYRKIPFDRNRRLALEAAFRVQLIDCRHRSQPVEPAVIYKFLRFSTAGALRDVQHLSGCNIADNLYEPYVQALLAASENDLARAGMYMKKHCELFPYDPSGLFYLSRFTSTEAHAIFPQDGDLLRSSLRAIEDENLSLPDQHNLLTDFYLPGAANGVVNLSIEIDIKKLDERPVRVVVTLNRTHSLEVEINEHNKIFSLPFQSNRVHNLLEIHPRMPLETHDSIMHLPLITVLRMQVTPAGMEPAL